MNVVDTSGWLEYFADGDNAGFFAPAIHDTQNLVVPVICIYEVFKKVLLTKGLAMAEFRTADLLKGQVVDITAAISMSAARISVELKLPMADSLILAVCKEYRATLWTQDEHFNGIDNVRYIPKPA